MHNSGAIAPRDSEAMLNQQRHCEPTGPRKARPDDRLREAIQNPAAAAVWIASALWRLAMTERTGATETLKPSNRKAGAAAAGGGGVGIDDAERGADQVVHEVDLGAGQERRGRRI